jgi:hypothetical protein
MNMILHDVHFSRFDIRQEDTLEEPQHLGLEFEAIVANPPFSAKWRGKDNVLFETDDRFSQYGALASKAYADWAFVQHMIYHLADNGTIAVVLPSGAMFRGSAEREIRKHLVERLNYIDAVIGLPLNLFYGTEIPPYILVVKKCRTDDENILFVDASEDFVQSGTKNTLSSDQVSKIVGAYRDRLNDGKYARVVPVAEVIENKCNLSVNRYIDKYKPPLEMSLAQVSDLLNANKETLREVDDQIREYTDSLNIPFPDGQNAEHLQNYKKTCARLLFRRSLRLLDQNGRRFQAEWDCVSLASLTQRCTQKNANNVLSRVLTNSAVRGIVDQGDYFDKDIANVDNLDGYYIVEKGDFVYNPRISANAPVGPINRNDLATGIMSPLYTVFRFEQRDTDFFKHYFATGEWHRYMYKIANFGARHDRMSIALDDLFDMVVPNPGEQEKFAISKFLNLLDRKLQLVLGSPSLISEI